MRGPDRTGIERRSAPALTAAILAVGAVVAAVVVATSDRAAPDPAPRPASQAEVEAAARSALERVRPSLVQACWTERTRGRATTDHIVAHYALSFDAEGVLRISGVTRTIPEVPGVAACLQDQVLRFTVPAPGAPASVDLALGIPDSRPGDDQARVPFPPPRS